LCVTTGWRPTETDNADINFNIESTSLQIQTDSEVGEEDKLLVMFDDTAELGVRFLDPPQYWIECTDYTNFTLPNSSKRDKQVWTISKHDGTLELRCDGEEIVKFNYSQVLSIENCRNKWSQSFSTIKFHDNTSEYYRAMPGGQHMY